MTVLDSQPHRLHAVDPLWQRIRADAEAALADEPEMAAFMHAVILRHADYEAALSFRLSQKLNSPLIGEMVLRETISAAYIDDPSIGQAARLDLLAVYDRDPACHNAAHPLLFFKGFLAIQGYRVANWLWRKGRRTMAYFLQMRSSERFSIDIHPAAQVGTGLMIDHAHAVVIGETATVGDNVSMLHSVTLGGTGKEDGDRHPKIGDGVLLGAGAKVLGNIRVGNCSRVAAGSVVLSDVPPCKTVAGVPARIVGEAGCPEPSLSMNHLLRGFETDG
ncbi:MAG: serine O-acetyltransferase [Pseudomonadota bacterium]